MTGRQAKPPHLKEIPPPNKREGAILNLARSFVLEYPGSGHDGERTDGWYRRRGSPEVIRAEFLKATSRGHLIDTDVGRVQVHLGRSRDGVIGLTVWFGNADRMRTFLRSTGLENAIMPGLLPFIASTLPGPRRETNGQTRDRRRRTSTIARALAIHYLSTAGDGRRTLADAASLYESVLQAAARSNVEAGRSLPDDWQALREGWRVEHRRVTTELEQKFGPLEPCSR
jgi:hypothetical protein